jgi:hypothetical protein
VKQTPTSSKVRSSQEISANLNSEDYGIELYYDEETAEELVAIAEQNHRYQAGLPVTPTPR